jgi:hypothetical protein
MIRRVIGPSDSRLSYRRKENVRRFPGFGIVEPEDAVACAADRATFWATGLLQRDKISVVDVPVPTAISGLTQPHSFFATLAWFTPTAPGRKSYRSVRLKVLEPSGLDALSVSAHSNQPESKQTSKGTLFMRCWKGNGAPVISPNMNIPLTVQRDPDQGTSIDDPVPFGLAVTVTMPGVLQIYEQVSERLGLVVRAAV